MGEHDTEKKSLNWTRQESIAVPSSERERRFAIRRVDWERVKRDVSHLSEKTPSLSVWYAILFGIAGTTGASIYPICMSANLPSWVVPLYVLTTAFSLIVGAVLVWLEQRLCSTRTAQVEDVRTDMTEIEGMFAPDNAVALLPINGSPENPDLDQLLGKWNVQGKRPDGQIGWEGCFTFYENYTALVEDKRGGGKSNGKWTIEKDRIRVNWERFESGKNVWDEFMLPIKADSISGRSWTGGTTHAIKI